MCVQSLNHVRLFVAPWTVAYQAPLSVEFSRQEYWSVLPFPTPGNLPNPEIKPTYLESPALAGGFFTTEHPGKPRLLLTPSQKPTAVSVPSPHLSILLLFITAFYFQISKSISFLLLCKKKYPKS